MNYKKIGAVLAVSVFLIGGVATYNNMNKSQATNGQTPPASSPMEGVEYVPEVEFNNFDIANIKANVSKIEIRNHTNNNTFKTISDKEVINKIVVAAESAKVKEMSDEVYEKIASSQSEGNSITLSFILNDGTVSSARVNLDLNIICINDKYNDVSFDLAKELLNELKDVANFKELNVPAPGM